MVSGVALVSCFADEASQTFEKRSTGDVLEGFLLSPNTEVFEEV
jgi:hypothetical protein